MVSDYYACIRRVDSWHENEREMGRKKNSAILQLMSKRTPLHRVPIDHIKNKVQDLTRALFKDRELPLRKWLLQKFEQI